MALRILHIDSSPRGAASHSRQLTAELVASLKQTNSDANVIYRDLRRAVPPFVDETWTQAAFTPPDALTPEQAESLRASDELVEEVLAANVLVVGVPMYNFNVPAAFKAWIDQIIRFGRTWVAEPNSDGTNRYTGLATGKKVFIVTSRGGGGYGLGEAMAAVNHQDSFLKTVFAFIGITNVNFIHINNTEKGEEAVRQAVDNARQAIRRAVAG